MKTTLLHITLAYLLLVSLTQAQPGPSVPPATGPDLPLDAYATVGSSLANDNCLPELGWSSAQIEAFLNGIREAFQQRPRVMDANAQVLQQRILQRQQELAEASEHRMLEYFKSPAQRESFMKQATRSYHLERSDSGLAYHVVPRGSGSRPEPDDMVVISYAVTSPDAKTELPGLGAQHRVVKVAELLPGLAEGVQMMGMGDSAMLILPPELSYGSGKWPAGVDHNLPLLFTIELEQIKPRS